MSNLITTSTVIYKKPLHDSLVPNSISFVGHCRRFDPLNITDCRLKKAFIKNGSDFTKGLKFQKRSQSVSKR